MRLERRGFRGMLFNDTVANDTSTAKPLTLNTLQETAKRLRNMPPMPIAIWFIDRPKAHRQFIEQLEQREYAPPKSSIFHHIPGLPVHNTTMDYIRGRIQISTLWHNDPLKSGIEQRRVFPFRDSGIYVQMNKGPHKRLILGELVSLREPANA